MQNFDVLQTNLSKQRGSGENGCRCCRPCLVRLVQQPTPSPSGLRVQYLPAKRATGAARYPEDLFRRAAHHRQVEVPASNDQWCKCGGGRAQAGRYQPPQPHVAPAVASETWAAARGAGGSDEPRLTTSRPWAAMTKTRRGRRPGDCEAGAAAAAVDNQEILDTAAVAEAHVRTRTANGIQDYAAVDALAKRLGSPTGRRS
jgi:hypothetical protein